VTTPLQGQDIKIARILVADDSDTSRAVTVHSLKAIGFAVDAVANGEDAVHACEATHYDLVLMDFHMPKLDGFEATKRIRAREENGHRATIIALTASGTEEDLVHCKDVGMDGHLFKMMSPQELRESVRSWLKGEAANAEMPQEWRGDAAEASGEESAQPARPASATGSIDWSVIEALREFSTDDDLLLAIVSSFHSNINDSLPELERAARAGEAETTRFIAHRLRGTCGNVGAMRMQFLFGRIEELGRAGITTGTSELIGDLWSEYARVRAALAETEGGTSRDDSLDRG
jgi:two-component system sensor histidine kinase/response regulator